MFGEKLKMLRKERGYTQAEFGQMLGLGASTIGMYENEKRSPDHKTLVQMGKLLGVSVDYLLSEQEDEQDENLEEIISDIKKRLLSNDSLMFNGKPLNRQELQRIAEVIELSIKVISEKQ